MLKNIAITGIALLMLCGAAQADTKIGFINNQRILAEKVPVFKLV